MDKLTKENFWNELHQKYTGEMEQFCEWIDEYKKQVDWNILFNSQSDYQNADGKNAKAPKYHELPVAMQIGIFLQYVAESDNRFGIEIPHIESSKDFDKIPDIIREFFFHEHDDVLTDHQNAKNDETLLSMEGERQASEEHF